ncbi:cytochrome P450 [Aurantimonas aggregata]|uniref:Cytochrome P450 n=1 Tax=Aurantimonas aggregata TaxID=2047720 RepID=A0A6L9MCH6_9HYPH|nr:cytochrome P450 [Aurantimonas aggregata]NDV85390.1 cytochrome P450 [Aurantimonas aggregata]
MSSSQQATENSGDAAGPPDASPLSFGIDWWAMLGDPNYLTDPYPELKRIRELAPIHYDGVSGIYFVPGYREFAMIAKTPLMGRDTRFWASGWSSPENQLRDPQTYELFTEFQPQMINANPPHHRRMRGVYEKAFRPGDMVRYLPMIEAECRRLLDRLPADQPFDFMTAFANPLPHRISLQLFGIPMEMDEPIAEWIAALSWLGNIVMTSEQKRAAQRAQTEFKAFVRSHLRALRDEPGDGFVALSLAAAEAGVMDEEETVNNVVMLISGSRTTLTLLGNGMLTLLQHPDQFARLRANPGLMRPAIEEMLRYEPGSSLIPRAGIKEFRCGDAVIPEGSLAIGLVGAINRDPALFDIPDVFDIGRRPNAQAAFGGGPHVCIGKALARMTAQVAFTALMNRFDRIELAGKPVWWTDRSDQRGLQSLPLLMREA